MGDKTWRFPGYSKLLQEQEASMKGDKSGDTPGTPRQFWRETNRETCQGQEAIL